MNFYYLERLLYCLDIIIFTFGRLSTFSRKVALLFFRTRKALLKVMASLWQNGVWSFQTGGTKFERFLPRNQHTERKLLNFENWISGGLRSFQKSEV